MGPWPVLCACSGQVVQRFGLARARLAEHQAVGQLDVTEVPGSATSVTAVLIVMITSMPMFYQRALPSDGNRACPVPGPPTDLGASYAGEGPQIVHHDGAVPGRDDPAAAPAP
jgi:hypothetical protein